MDKSTSIGRKFHDEIARGGTVDFDTAQKIEKKLKTILRQLPQHMRKI